MKNILKMAILTEIVTFNTLYANGFNKFSTISWDWIAIAVLVVLFLLLVFSIIKDIRANKKKINSFIVKEKCKNDSDKRYLNDINNTRIESTNKLKNSILNISKDEKNILNELKKVYKSIHLSNKEENIFLNISTNSEIGEVESFKLNSLFNELSNYDIIHKSDVKTAKQTLVGNKEIISDIFLLLSNLQTKEHNFDKPKFNIELNESNNTLQIEVARDLKLNKSLENVLQGNISPYYDNSTNKYYGIYLYLTKHLANRINATLKINSSDDKYNVLIDIPVDIKYETGEILKPNLVLKERKRALIVSEPETGHLVAKYLNELNFDTKIEPIKELNKELPNFIEYDIAFIYSKIFEPILTDYLKTIKAYTPLKIVALVDSSNSLYPTKIVDDVIDLNSLKDTIYPKVTKLFRDELISQKSVEPVDSSNKDKVVYEPANKELAKEAKVLVADDDITNLHILTYMFKEYNIKVTTATNGVDVLNIIDKEDFDLIILDSVMPKLDGYETIKRIRENPKFNSTPIVIHTSFSIEKSSMDRIFQLGFDSYLPKPFNKYDLKSLVERYIPVYTEPKRKKVVKKKSLDKESLKEFIAIYGDSDRMLEKYVKENRKEQAFSLLKDLKDVAQKIEANKFITSLEKVENSLKESSELDSSLLYSLSSNLQELKSNIMKQLSA